MPPSKVADAMERNSSTNLDQFQRWHRPGRASLQAGVQDRPTLKGLSRCGHFQWPQRLKRFVGAQRTRRWSAALPGLARTTPIL